MANLQHVNRYEGPATGRLTCEHLTYWTSSYCEMGKTRETWQEVDGRIPAQAAGTCGTPRNCTHYVVLVVP